MRNFLHTLKTRSHAVLYAGAFVPLADYTGSKKLSALFSNDQNLVTYLNTLFTMAITIGAVLAVLRLLYAGYTYMASDVFTNKSKAKEIFQDVFYGLFLLLSIYIILAQINPNLLKLDVKLEAIKPSEIAPPSSAPATSGDQAMLDRILQDEPVKIAMLKGSGIAVNKNPCTVVGQINCTNVGLLGTSAINGLQILKRNCRCAVMVSGGTEFWLHNTHGPNKSIVDLVKDGGGALDRYIQTGSRTVSTTFIKGQSTDVYTIDGGTFYSENSAHWHVVF